MKILKRILAGFLILIFILCAATAAYCSVYYHAEDTVSAAYDDCAASAVSVTEYKNKMICFIPDDPIAGFIFYPGGKVEYTAYVPLMCDLAEQGILCVLLHMPGNLAIMDVNAAARVPSYFPEISDWYIGGHSLGGSAAAMYAAKHAEALEGIVFLASYSTSDLHDSGLKTLSIFGSEDGVLSVDSYSKNLTNLPSDIHELEIEGGCHAYFGCYGPQKGDGIPSVTPEEQQQITANAILEFISAA